jgi:hypothetical protein
MDYHNGLVPVLFAFSRTPIATVSMGNVFEACGLVREPAQNLIV